MYESMGASVIEGAASAAGIGLSIVKDPFLPEFGCEIKRLQRIDQGLAPGRRCPRTPAHKAASPAGVGLRHAVGPLRLFVMHKQHPWVLPLATAGIIAGIYLLGYSAGRAQRGGRGV